MKIEEAIAHLDVATSFNSTKHTISNSQLTAWLEELRERRKQPEVILCKD